MKKTFILICISTLVIISCVFAKYVEYSRKQNEIQKINKEFLLYQNSDIKINTIVSIMNKAIQLNKTNKIQQDNKKIFIENETNSLKIYLETKSSEDENLKIPMEELILNEKAGIEKVEYAFSDLTFTITNIQYHKKSGQVKSITFTQK